MRKIREEMKIVVFLESEKALTATLKTPRPLCGLLS